MYIIKNFNLFKKHLFKYFIILLFKYIKLKKKFNVYNFSICNKIYIY